MQYPARMGEVNGPGQRQQQLGRLDTGDGRGAGLEPLGEVVSRTIGQGNVANRPDLTGLVDRHQVGMVQPGGSAGFALKAAQALGVGQGALRGIFRATSRQSVGS